ncbi:MAG: VOC family protein [Pseudomonadota bacterium]
MQDVQATAPNTIASETPEPSILGIYHININVTNLERSQKFYEMLGFRVIQEFDQAGVPELDQGLGMEYSDNRALFMGLGRHSPETVLDLAEWREPKAQDRPMPKINDIGVPRIALRVRNIDALYEKLTGLGVEFITEPKSLDFLERSPRFAVCKDPDGVFIEFVEVGRRAK